MTREEISFLDHFGFCSISSNQVRMLWIWAVLARICEALRNKGYDAEADQLEQEATRAVEEMGLSLEEAKLQAPGAPRRRGTLPAQCGGCGAPLTPDGVEWHDAQTAECTYCGTIAKTS